MIKYIVRVKKWFDKSGGNTYHAVRIIRTKDREILKCDWIYGYEDQYKVTALRKMLKQKWIPQKYKSIRIIQYEIEKNYPIYWIDEGYKSKKEVVAWGE
jgi:hypothetical protein